MAYNAGKKTYTVVRRTKNAVEVSRKTSYSNQITHDPASSKVKLLERVCPDPHSRENGMYEKMRVIHVSLNTSNTREVVSLISKNRITVLKKTKRS